MYFKLHIDKYTMLYSKARYTLSNPHGFKSQLDSFSKILLTFHSKIRMQMVSNHELDSFFSKRTFLTSLKNHVYGFHLLINLLIRIELYVFAEFDFFLYFLLIMLLLIVSYLIYIIQFGDALDWYYQLDTRFNFYFLIRIIVLLPSVYLFLE